MGRRGVSTSSPLSHTLAAATLPTRRVNILVVLDERDRRERAVEALSPVAPVVQPERPNVAREVEPSVPATVIHRVPLRQKQGRISNLKNGVVELTESYIFDLYDLYYLCLAAKDTHTFTASYIREREDVDN